MTISHMDVAKAILDTIDAFVDDCPAFEGHGVQRLSVDDGIHKDSLDMTIEVDGERFYVSVRHADAEVQ